MVFLMSFGYLSLPTLSRLHADGRHERMRRLYQSVSKWMGLSMLPVFLWLLLFSELTIAATFGERYTGAATTLRVLALAFAGRVLVGPNTRALTSLGRSKFVFYATAGAAVLNLSLNVVLIPAYGTEGAAVATLLAYLSVNIVKSVRLYLDYGLTPLTGGLVRPLVASTGLALLAYALVVPIVGATLTTAVALSVVCAVCYPVVIVATGGVEREELLIIESVEDRFGISLDPVRRVLEWLT
jgi:O-antigen/teichoic acid export membrane protein